MKKTIYEQHSVVKLQRRLENLAQKTDDLYMRNELVELLSLVLDVHDRLQDIGELENFDE